MPGTERTNDSHENVVVQAHTLFHRLWSKARGCETYDKREWQHFEALLQQLGLSI
jgi:hypothetical protein